MIPVNEPLIGAREEEYVLECLRTGGISSAGRCIERFEEGWATYCGQKFGIAVSNGTTALQVAVGCLGLKPGDLVIIPTFTIISCALAVIYNGGIPVLADCDPRTWCLSPEGVKQAESHHARSYLRSSRGHGPSRRAGGGLFPGDH
jgi:perosamine synthetase